MKASLFSLLLLISATLLHAQDQVDYMGKWYTPSTKSPFNQIRIQASSISDEKPLILFYKDEQLWKRTLGSWNAENGLTLAAHVEENGDNWSMRISLDESGGQLQLYGKIRRTETGIRQSIKLLFSRNKILVPAALLEEKEKPQVMQIGEVELDKPKPSQKASFDIKLPSCKPCQQFVIHLQNEDYQKTAIPNNNGLGKFSQVPYGTYEISVGWKGKMDRPDSPPYKKIKVQIKKGHKKNYSVPLK